MGEIQNNKKPKIRFAGFTDAWEQRKLSKICTMHARIGWQNLRTSEFLNQGDYYLITGTDFDDGRINFKTCHFVTRDRFEQDRNIQISNGNILITKDGTLGKVAFVEGLSKPATLNAGVFNVKICDNRLDGRFLFQYLKGPFLMDYVHRKATGGTIKHLNQNILVDFPVFSPRVKEQEQLGSFFSTIDNAIVLHQRKLDQMKALKKSLLQKMFPEEGEDKPRIRFAGFADAWEQRKFSELTFSAGKKNKENVPLVSYSITNENGFIPQDIQFENGGTMKDADKSMYYIVSPHSFAYNPARINVGSIGYYSGDKDVIVSSLYEVFKTEESLNDSFLWQWFKTTLFQKSITCLQEGGVRLYFYYDKLCLSFISLPSLEEQKKIGTLLDKTDGAIVLHQRELDELKELKKSLLQKMFI